MSIWMEHTWFLGFWKKCRLSRLHLDGSEMERDLKMGRRFSSGSRSATGVSHFGRSHFGAGIVSHFGRLGAGIRGTKMGWESGLAERLSRSEPEETPVELIPFRETKGAEKLIPLAGSEFQDEILNFGISFNGKKLFWEIVILSIQIFW